MPRLGLIVVDEEHDPSYKQQEGARYSARDLAVCRGPPRRRDRGARLGHAVARELAAAPRRAATAGSACRARIGGGALPTVRLVDMNRLPRAGGDRRAGAAAASRRCRPRMARGEQSLVFLNRRGYAPVLHCADCGWKSGCPHCSAWRVFHKLDRTLRCHHCGFDRARAARLPGLRQPRHRADRPRHRAAGGAARRAARHARRRPARIARIDADSTRGQGRARGAASAPCMQARSTSWSARR